MTKPSVPNSCLPTDSDRRIRLELPFEADSFLVDIAQNFRKAFPLSCPECGHSSDGDTWVRSITGVMCCSSCGIDPNILGYEIRAITHDGLGNYPIPVSETYIDFTSASHWIRTIREEQQTIKRNPNWECGTFTYDLHRRFKYFGVYYKGKEVEIY